MFLILFSKQVTLEPCFFIRVELDHFSGQSLQKMRLCSIFLMTRAMEENRNMDAIRAFMALLQIQYRERRFARRFEFLQLYTTSNVSAQIAPVLFEKAQFMTALGIIAASCKP